MRLSRNNNALLWLLPKFPSFQNVLPSNRRAKMFIKLLWGYVNLLKDRWDLPHASCFTQAVGIKGSWSLGYKFGTNSCCILFNLLVCFDAEEKTPYAPLTKFHKMTMEFSQLKWSLIIHFSLSIFTQRNK